MSANPVEARTLLVPRYSALRTFARSYTARRYRVLFITLASTVTAFPIISAFHLSGLVFESLLGASLIMASLPVASGRTRNVLLVVMGAVWVLRPVAELLGFRALSALSLCAWTLIGLIAAGSAIRYAMSGVRIDSE